MRHEPSGQYKWILHIEGHFSKYSQLYPLKSKHAEPIAQAFTGCIAAFLPPKIVQTDNGKEFKGALFTESRLLMEHQDHLKPKVWLSKPME
jgi:hypothetical protein